MSGHCSRDVGRSARVAIGRMRSKKSRSVGSSPVNGSPCDTIECAGVVAVAGPPHEILFDGEWRTGGERAIDAIVPAALIRIRVVRIEEHTLAGGSWLVPAQQRPRRARCRGQRHLLFVAAFIKADILDAIARLEDLKS